MRLENQPGAVTFSTPCGCAVSTPTAASAALPVDAHSASLAGHAQALLRVVAAYLLLTHASAKLFHVPHIAMFDGLSLFSLLGAAGVIELFGSVLVLLGFFTRAAAFVLSGELAFAYFHRARAATVRSFAVDESGRAGRVDVVHFPVHLGGGAGRVEYRCASLNHLGHSSSSSLKSDATTPRSHVVRVSL